MSKVLLKVGTTLTAVLLLFAVPASAQGNSAELQKVRDTVSEQFSEIDPQEIFESPIEGWYTVRKGAIIANIITRASLRACSVRLVLS